MINETFVRRKIALIQDEFSNLEKLSKYSFDEIVSDFIKQAALERILEKIIMRAIDINQHIIAELSNKDTIAPKDYKETFLRLVNFKIYPADFAEQIGKSVGARNVLVHDYDKVDYSIIYSSVKDCLKDYHQYCQYILDFLEKK